MYCSITRTGLCGECARTSPVLAALRCSTLYPQLRLRRWRFRFLRITTLRHFPGDQRTLVLRFFIVWTQFQDFIECPECLDVFSEVHKSQTLIEPCVCELGINVGCLT